MRSRFDDPMPTPGAAGLAQRSPSAAKAVEPGARGRLRRGGPVFCGTDDRARSAPVGFAAEGWASRTLFAAHVAAAPGVALAAAIGNCAAAVSASAPQATRALSARVVCRVDAAVGGRAATAAVGCGPAAAVGCRPAAAL